MFNARGKVCLLASLALVFLFSNLKALAESIKVEVVEETERKEVKPFCSKVSEADAKKQCEAWLEKQRKSLGERVLTSYCSPAELVSDAKSNCLYKSKGEVKYVIKTYRTETKVP